MLLERKKNRFIVYLFCTEWETRPFSIYSFGLQFEYAGKNMYNAGKTSALLSSDDSGANRCYVLAHCAPLLFGKKQTISRFCCC